MHTPYDKDTIILIDDEPFHMFWMHDYVESLGYKIEQCTNLNEGVAAIGKNNIECNCSPPQNLSPPNHPSLRPGLEGAHFVGGA